MPRLRASLVGYATGRKVPMRSVADRDSVTSRCSGRSVPAHPAHFGPLRSVAARGRPADGQRRMIVPVCRRVAGVSERVGSRAPANWAQRLDPAPATSIADVIGRVPAQHPLGPVGRDQSFSGRSPAGEKCADDGGGES